jgi:RNA polymerase sigma-70 factor, ECF subfamily
MQSMRDEEVMLNYQKGERQAMDELLRRYKIPVYHFALRLSFNEADAQDIAQEVFLKVHQYKDAYRPIGKFSTWLFSIAHHAYVSRLRKKKWMCLWPRKSDDPDELVEFQSADPSPQDAASTQEMAEIVKRSVQGLPFLQKEALILREYHNLNYDEIAKILHTSLGTVKTLIHRARQHLKEKLLPVVKEFRGGNNG